MNVVYLSPFHYLPQEVPRLFDQCAPGILRHHKLTREHNLALSVSLHVCPANRPQRRLTRLVKHLEEPGRHVKSVALGVLLVDGLTHAEAVVRVPTSVDHELDTSICVGAASLRPVIHDYHARLRILDHDCRVDWLVVRRGPLTSRGAEVLRLIYDMPHDSHTVGVGEEETICFKLGVFPGDDHVSALPVRDPAKEHFVFNLVTSLVEFDLDLRLNAVAFLAISYIELLDYLPLYSLERGYTMWVVVGLLTIRAEDVGP